MSPVCDDCGMYPCECQPVVSFVYISTVLEFQNMTMNGHYRLAGDIDFGGVVMRAIGDNTGMVAYSAVVAPSVFSGIFDGNGFALLNIQIRDWGSRSVQPHAGLFMETDGAVIRNVSIENMNLMSIGVAGGMIVGISRNTVIENVFIRSSG